MTQNHAERDHATWSASASSRNFKCPGSLALTINAPETTSEAADWGTCCHQISERCLRDGGDADRFIGTTEKAKKFSFEVDEEMAETAQRYVDYVRKQFGEPGWVSGDKCDECQGRGYNQTDTDACAECDGTGKQWGHANTLWIEQRFSLADLHPPFDAGGTGDAVIYITAEKRLEIVDLKGGRGVVVAVKGNPQLRTYALGALMANKRLDVEQVTVTIVQPRAGHPDGRIRSETFHVIDLMEWASDMMAAMHRAKEAIVRQSEMPESAWAATYLSPGDHCRDTFCKAAGTCPALRQRVLDAVGVHFDPIDDTPKLANSPDSGSPEERAARLDTLDMIESWVKEVRAHEHRMAEMGQPAPGYGLVEKTGREKWADEADDLVRAKLADAGLPADKWLNPGKLRTPKQVRDAVKKAKLDIDLSGLSSTPTGGTNLVRLDQTSRVAKSPVETHFTAIQE